MKPLSSVEPASHFERADLQLLIGSTKKRGMTIMTSRSIAINEKIAKYLAKLPAVDKVKNGRIYYRAAFRDECMRKYHAGMKPSQIFRDAGLGPEIIGAKRVERCFGRWRSQERNLAENNMPDTFKTTD
jgi:hypothetical protein